MKRIEYFNRYLSPYVRGKAFKLTPVEHLEEECYEYNALTGAFVWEDTYDGCSYWARQQELLEKNYFKEDAVKRPRLSLTQKQVDELKNNPLSCVKLSKKYKISASSIWRVKHNLYNVKNETKV